jgi:membrane fusion protein, copper/silver efflux system
MAQHEPESGQAADQPRDAHRSSRWSAVWFALKAIQIGLRFIVVLVGIGLVIGYWDTIQNYWDKWTRPAAEKATALAGGEEFYCPMHPSVVRDSLDPGGAIPKCPICGMPLSKRKKGQAEPLPEGVLSRVQLSPYRIELAGIQTAEVTHHPLTLDVRALGYVAVDERKLARIVVRAAGYVEKLYVNESFALVRKGEPLAEIYSPDLYTAAQELLIAERGQNAQLISVAHEKLKLLGVAEEEIDQIARSGNARSRLVIRAPHGGHVFQKNIVEGDRVEAGQMLFEVADLSTVWIEGELYEKDAASLKPGEAVEATVDAYPGRVFKGRVNLVHPHVETATRTLRVRCEMDNPHHELRPGMFATLTLKTPVVQLEPFHSVLAAEQRQDKLRRELAAKLALDVGSSPDRATPGGAADAGSGDPRKSEDPRALAGTRTSPDTRTTADTHETGDTPTAGDARTTANTRTTEMARKTGEAERSDSATSEANLPATLQVEIQPLIAMQRVCPVTGLELGAMGAPVPVTLVDRLVLLCCKNCKEDVLARPDYYLARMRKVTDDGGVLTVPELSVIDTGTQKVVYIERKPGVFEGVPVTLGPRSGGYYAVIDGVLAGDRVAAAGAFLVDAETRLNPATSATYFGASGGPSDEKQGMPPREK